MNRAYHHGNLRPALVEAAVELARDKGPDGVVLREVARRTGVSHNAAYRHFSDREGLLAEVAQVGMDRLEQAMLDQMATVRTRDPVRRAVRRLRETGRAYVRFALAEPGLFAVAFATPFEEHGDGGPYVLLNKVLDDLVAVGAMPPERREAADVMCWAGVHGFAMLHLSGPLRDVPESDREPLLDRCLDLVELALVPQ